jgi:hypothetical protein
MYTAETAKLPNAFHIIIRNLEENCIETKMNEQSVLVAGCVDVCNNL